MLRKRRKQHSHIRIFLVFTICSNTHTHTHNTMHTTHTHSSITRLEIPKQDTVTANQIYFWEMERKLCCSRQLCWRTAPWCPRVYALSAPCTQIIGLFSIVYWFLLPQQAILTVWTDWHWGISFGQNEILKDLQGKRFCLSSFFLSFFLKRNLRKLGKRTRGMCRG